MYMAQVKKQCTGGNTVYGGINSMEKLEQNLTANCIPRDIFEMDYTQFEDFLEKRRKLMAQKFGITMKCSNDVCLDLCNRVDVRLEDDLWNLIT